MIRALAAGAILLVAGGAAPPRDPFANRVAVATSRCIDGIGQQSLIVVDDRTLLYNPVGKRIYRNDLPDRCAGLSADDVLIIERFGARYCQADRFQAVDRGSRIPGPFCRLGKFTAYEKPGRR